MQQKDQIQELAEIQWAAPEFEKQLKTTAWFLTVGIFALFFFTIAFLMESLIFAVLIVIAIFTVFVYAVKEPPIITFKINGEGIMIGEKLYPYEDIDSFWIFYTPPSPKELSVKSKKTLSLMIKIPLAEQDPIAIRQALIKFIPEEKQEESLADIIARGIGF